MKILKKVILSLIVSFPLALLSSSAKYNTNIPDGWSGVGIPFSKIRSGGIGGDIIYDNLAPLKNYFVWFLLTLFVIFLTTFIWSKIRNRSK